MINLRSDHLSLEGDFSEQAKEAFSYILNKDGAGSDYLGWIDLPVAYDKDEFERIRAAAAKIRKSSKVLIVIGVGGSYLGAAAALDFLHSKYYNQLGKGPEIYFLGNSYSGAEIDSVLSLCAGKDVSVNMISKSGATTESAVAFRFVLDFLQKKYTDDELKDRIFITTDREKGALKQLAEKKQWQCFVIPSNIGGRFSVLTAVGLLPIAVSGADIGAVMQGAQDMQKRVFRETLASSAVKYGIIRNQFLASGRNVELFVTYDPNLRLFCEWLKQLFGESEGKGKQGIFPASAIFTTDLHSLGQFIQDGTPLLFETVLQRAKDPRPLALPPFPDNFDGLQYLEGKTLKHIESKALEGALQAHAGSGAQSVVIEYADFDEYTFGQLVYFFFFACAESAYILGVNPFDQPGVEIYKKNMFTLLGKPES